MQQKELNDKLISAAINGDIKKVRELIENGADVDAKNNDGKTALHKAALRGNVDVVKVLIENRADVVAKDECGKTALRSHLPF